MLRSQPQRAAREKLHGVKTGVWMPSVCSPPPPLTLWKPEELAPGIGGAVRTNTRVESANQVFSEFVPSHLNTLRLQFEFDPRPWWSLCQTNFQDVPKYNNKPVLVQVQISQIKRPRMEPCGTPDWPWTTLMCSQQSTLPLWWLFHVFPSPSGTTPSATGRGTGSGSTRPAPPATQSSTTWSPTRPMSLASAPTRTTAGARGANQSFTTPTWVVRDWSIFGIILFRSKEFSYFSQGEMKSDCLTYFFLSAISQIKSCVLLIPSQL